LPTVRPAVGRARGEHDEQEARVAGSAKRERQLAREHYERQQARRAERAAKRRRRNQVLAVVIAVLLIVGGIVFLQATLGGDDKVTAADKSPSTSATPTPSTTPTPSPSATPGAGCTYTKSGQAAKDVGLPAYDVTKAASYRKPFTATIKTNQGDIVVQLAADKAPCTANSFKHLAESKYYDGSPCHRLTTDNIFVLQCGDPTGSGSGGPGYQFGVENAPADGNYPAGTLAMARTSDPGSNGSQFFVVYKDTQLPDANGYTIFGHVTKGLDVVQKVADAGVEGGGGDGAPVQKVTVQTVTIGKG
jgi:peptidyl-prolyl cis-trans isomerase B (cyclophilin B)